MLPQTSGYGLDPALRRELAPSPGLSANSLLSSGGMLTAGIKICGRAPAVDSESGLSLRQPTRAR